MKQIFCIVLLLTIANVALFALNQMDLMTTLYGEFNGDEFGAAMVAMDYNGDGYDDLALSCVRWMDGGFHFPGRIYVFKGNAQLQDTTVANDDPVTPSASVEDWRVNVYPNPCSRGTDRVRLELLGDSFSKAGHYSYRLFNIRGQKIHEGLISNEEHSNRNFSVDLDGLSSGIYQVMVLLDGEIKNTKRFVVH